MTYEMMYCNVDGLRREIGGREIVRVRTTD